MTEENLGKAVLTIEIRDKEAKVALDKLRQDIDSINKSASSIGRERATTTPRTQTPGSASSQTQKRLDATKEREAKAAERTAIAEERRARATAAAEAKSRRQDLQGRISSGLIGGAFPLLFGQGGGASIGGLLGGVAGGGAAGFGASLVGTLVGSQVDLLNQRFGELAIALQDPIASFDVFIQKATLASTAQESLAKALQETGQNAAAAALIEREASRTIDPVIAQGVAVSQDKFNRALSDTSDILGQIVNGPARGFVDFLTSVLQGISGPPQLAGESPAAQRERSIANARKRSQGGLATAGLGLSLILGGALAVPTGVGSLPGALAVGTGASLIAGGLSGASAAETDVRVASSKEVIAAEAAVTAAKEGQVQLEQQILQARAAGKKGLEEQLSLSAQFNALQVQELQGLSRIQQELASKKDGRNDAAYQKEAIRQEKELAAAIELRRQALLASASAAQTASVTELKNARQLVGKSGSEREVLTTELEIKAAIDAAYQAQLQLNKARKEGANATEIEAQEKIVNTLINKRIQTELEGQEKIRKIRSDAAAQTQLEATQTNLALQGIGERIAATQALSKAERGVARETLASTQAIQAGINEAKRREQEIGAQIDAARQRGDETGAASLVNQQKIAANETRLELEKGALALTEAGEQLRDNLRNAIVDFTRIRSDPQGLNKFLSPQQQDERARQDFQLLLPQFRQAQARFTQLTGAQAPVFTGPTAGVNDAIRDFIQRTETEGQAGKDLAGTQQALATNLEAYNKTIADLATVTKTLADKNWAVNVNVQGSAGAQILGDVVNATT